MGREVDTVDAMLTPRPLDRDPSRREPARPRWQWMALVGLVLIAVTVVAAYVRIPYLAVAPGSARHLDDLVEVPKEKLHPSPGRILVTTVAVWEVTPIEAVVGWLDRDVDVLPRTRLLGPTSSRGQFKRRSVQAMSDSKEIAVVVALRRLGLPVTEHGKGALVVAVESGTPADGRVSQGEVITAVDARPTPLSQQAAEQVRAGAAGEPVTLEVQGVDGETRVERVVLASRPEGGGGFLGVMLTTKGHGFDLPFEVDIDSAGIGGSSAGLAFTLEVLDALTPGDLTGGKDVAVTGTMELDGTVGDVGGVAQKVAAAQAAGARHFLVPDGEFEAAAARAGGELEVIKVSDLEDALAALGRLGGDVGPLAAGPKGAHG